jgi:hypothetical protein
MITGHENGLEEMDQGRPGKGQWLKAIQWTNLRMSNIEMVIGGHGQVLTLDDLKAFQSLILEKTE